MLNEWRVETVIAKSLFVVFCNMNFLQDLIVTNTFHYPLDYHWRSCLW